MTQSTLPGPSALPTPSHSAVQLKLVHCHLLQEACPDHSHPQEGGDPRPPTGPPSLHVVTVREHISFPHWMASCQGRRLRVTPPCPGIQHRTDSVWGSLLATRKPSPITGSGNRLSPSLGRPEEPEIHARWSFARSPASSPRTLPSQLCTTGPTPDPPQHRYPSGAPALNTSPKITARAVSGVSPVGHPRASSFHETPPSALCDEHPYPISQMNRLRDSQSPTASKGQGRGLDPTSA